MTRYLAACMPGAVTGLLLVLFSLADRAEAQVHTHALASLTSNGQLATRGPVLDEDLILKSSYSAEGEPWLDAEGWAPWLGDIDGDGVWDVPGDIDAVSVIDIHSPPIPSGIVFSLLQDEGPFLDGDLLVRQPDGSIAVWLAETTLRNALGTTSTSLDVDALAIDGAGEVYFSLASDLSNTVLGLVKDGDILFLDASGTPSVAYSEDDLQQIVDTTHGTAMSAILDCIALAFDPLDGVLCFVPQSPSTIDGTAYRVLGQTVVGFEESAWGFAGAAEIDAITFFEAPDIPLPRVHIDPASMPAAQFTPCSIRGGTPGGLFLLIAGTREGQLVVPGLAGFGALLVDPGGSVFGQLSASWADLIGVFDGNGAADLSIRADFLGVVPLDLVVQVVDLGSGGVSTPSALHIH